MKNTLVVIALAALGSLEFWHELGRDDLPSPQMCTAADAGRDVIDETIHLQLHNHR